MSNEYLAVLKASYDYDPQSDDEIQIKEDQILFLIERTDEDWWKVKVKGDGQEDNTPVGLVPAAYLEQADHSSLVKALYDYDAAAPGELSIKEDDILLAFDADEEWLLVQSDKAEKAGYVPANYVEEHAGEDSTPASTSGPALVIPDSPPKPSAPYVDPTELVAANKSQADDIRTWTVTHVDNKNKKKKGTLGCGNGNVFFASDSDKAPVQKWQTRDIVDISVEKNKHIHITIGGSDSTKLHFSVTKDIDEIVAKLESSKALSQPTSHTDQVEDAEPERAARSPKPKASVHFSPASPVIIPPREPSEADDDEDHTSHPSGEDGEQATALYDFQADGEDELTVTEGEPLFVIEKDDNDEWWKCRNAHGAEGVVPASYIEISAASSGAPAQKGSTEEEEEEEEEDPGAPEREAAAARAAEEAARAQREAEEKLAKEKAAEQAEKERRKREAQKQAEAAEAARAKRKKEAEARAKAASPPARPSPPPDQERSSRDRPSSSKGSEKKASVDPASKPPSDKVRTWHDRSGQFRVDAAFLGVAGGKVRLHKVNGVIVEVPTDKMSADDMRYIEKLAQRERERRSRHSDDDVPLAVTRRKSMAEQQRKKAPQVDWFEFFLNAGCDVDDCSRYAASFERDKIDYSILPDITDSTMRSLGLREGDIIRVTKVIKEKFPKKDPREEQIKEDEKLARSLQGKESPPAPNLFASGPDGALKAPRRGRPTPSSSTPPATVDLISLSTTSDQIPRSDSPSIMTPTKANTPAAKPSGFEDDAWTNRPSSTKPVAATSPPPIQAPRAPSAPPTAAPAAVAPPNLPANGGSPSLAKTTESDIFDQLSRLAELRKSQPQAPTPPPVQPAQNPSSTFNTPSPGMGVGQPSTPMGQIQSPITSPPPQQQQYNGPRGPFAPVPANESLLRPLVPTQTGFSGFVPTRPTQSTPSNDMSPFAGGVPAPPQPQFLTTGFPGGSLMSQPTGFPGGSLMSQPTGFQPSIMSQPTGMPMNGFQSPNFGVQTNPTGFNPGFGQLNFSQSPPPVPPLPASPPPNNTNPANIFAQMKSGTFANENQSEPQPSNKYDALRPNPVFAQPTGYYGGYR